jgi:hypothetical protein
MNYKTLLKILLVIGIIAVAMGLVSAEKALLEEGKYKVGKDLPAGEYYVKCNSYNLYLAVSSDSSGDLDSVIYNLNTHGGAYITVEDGEYLEIQGGELYELKDAPDTGADNGKYKEGMYKVGKDIPAGEYTVKSTEDQGYIEVSSNSRHKVEDIVANDNFKTDKKVKLSDGQYLTLTNGAQIDADDSAKSSSSSSSGSSDSKSKEITIDTIAFKIPDGFKEDSSAFEDYKKDMEKSDVKYSIDGKTFIKGNDAFTLGVITYDGYDVDDSIAKSVGSKDMTINGVDGYEYDYKSQEGFVFAKNGKLVAVMANDDDLLDQIVTK